MQRRQTITLTKTEITYLDKTAGRHAQTSITASSISISNGSGNKTTISANKISIESGNDKIELTQNS